MAQIEEERWFAVIVSAAETAVNSGIVRSIEQLDSLSDASDDDCSERWFREFAGVQPRSAHRQSGE